MAPSSLPRPPAPPTRAAAPGLFRRKPPLRRGPPHPLPEPDLMPPGGGVCLSPGRRSHLGPAQEDPPEQNGNQWLRLPPAALHPVSQLPHDGAPSPGRGDFLPLARWGFLPRSGFVWLSALQRDQERGVAPALRLPPKICILALAMMIAGIPTVPVPGVREEDMIRAAQDFMAAAGPPPWGAAEGPGPPRRRRWAAVPRPAPPCGRDQQQRRRGAGRSLLPLFLARREK